MADVELKQFKLKLKIVSPDKELNNKLMVMLKEEHDCFGVDFSESHDECKKCTILAELVDKRAPLHEFCKQFVEDRNTILKFAGIELKEEEKKALEKEEEELEKEDEKGEEEEMEEKKEETQSTEPVEKPQKPEKEKKEKAPKEKKEKKVAKSCNKGLLEVGTKLFAEGKSEAEVLAALTEKCKGNEKRAARYLERAKAAK